MARRPVITRILGWLGGPNEDETPVPDKPNIVVPASLVSRSERNRIIGRLANAAAPVNTSTEAVYRYVKELSNRTATTRKDNVEIHKLAPEIDQSASIIIPSILAPNDLRDSEIQFVCEHPDLNQEENSRVADVIKNYFNKSLNFSTRIPEWIREALYLSGAKPLLTIPVTELDNQINNPANFTTRPGVESFIDSIEKTVFQSIYGIGDNPNISKQETDKSYRELVGAMESHFETFANDIIETAETIEDRQGLFTKFFQTSYDDRKKYGSAIEALARDVLSPANLAIVDNPDVLKVTNFQKKVIQNIGDVFKKRYKTSSYVSLSADDSAAPSGHRLEGHPLFMELPSGSVVPIFIPGTPSDHIGYFVMIDEYGNPVHVIDTNEHNFKMNSTEQRSTFDNLFKAFGFEDLKVYGTAQSRLMTDVYQQIVDKHLKNRMRQAGLPNVTIGTDNSIYKCMFSRYLQKRKTKLLFVPKEMLTYFCYQYNENGTGRSKLEDIKFVLSLRITVIVCRMLSAMNNAVDRRRLDVTLNDNIGNPFEFIENIKREAINKYLISFSYNPDEITRSLAQRSISVNAKGLPGAPEFEITNEANERTSAQFDSSFDDDLKNLLILQLKVPPSALNSLSEDEYSRSIATSNLFFSRYIMGEQKTTIKHATAFVRQYVSLSKPLQELISAEVNINEKKSSNEAIVSKTESGTKSKSKTKSKINAEDISNEPGVGEDIKNISVASIIDHISMILPSPNIAADKTQFEELNSVLEAIKNVVDTIFDEDMFADDDDLRKIITMVRSSIKSDIVGEHVRKLGISSSIDIPDFDSLMPKKILEIQQIIMNFKAAIQEQKRTMTPILEGSPAENPDNTGLDSSFPSGPPDSRF